MPLPCAAWSITSAGRGPAVKKPRKIKEGELKTALVTGGSGAIGAAICRALSALGLQVIVHANRRLEEAQRLAAELQAECRQRAADRRADRPAAAGYQQIGRAHV